MMDFDWDWGEPSEPPAYKEARRDTDRVVISPPPPPPIKRRDPVVSTFYIDNGMFVFQTSSGKESIGHLVRIADKVYMQDENARHLAPFSVIKPVAKELDI